MNQHTCEVSEINTYSFLSGLFVNVYFIIICSVFVGWKSWIYKIAEQIYFVLFFHLWYNSFMEISRSKRFYVHYFIFFLIYGWKLWKTIVGVNQSCQFCPSRLPKKGCLNYCWTMRLLVSSWVLETIGNSGVNTELEMSPNTSKHCQTNYPILPPIWELIKHEMNNKMHNGPRCLACVGGYKILIGYRLMEDFLK